MPTADLLAPSFWGDVDAMHEFFTEVRADGPVWRDETNGLWAVVRHAELLDVERRSAVFTSRPVSLVGQRRRDEHDRGGRPRAHGATPRRQRRGSLPRSVQSMTPLLERIVGHCVDELVATVARDGDVEVIDTLAAQLPGRLTAILLGFPEDRWPDIRSWSERLMRIDSAMTDMDVMMGVGGAIQEFAELLGETARERRGCPMDDLVSDWVGAEFDDAQLVHETGLVISGGAETTRTVISRGLRVLADHPEQWDAAAADPTLVPGLVEEIIRWVTPLNNFFRTAAEPTRIGTTEVAAGDRICLVYPSANRDETMFTEPFRFDIRRSPNPHVAFGGGTHFCLGVNLARTELRILFGALTQRITNLRVVTEPDIEPNLFAGAVRSFRLAFDLR